MMHHTHQKAFTLIETLVAVSLLVVSVAAPMTLAAQSISSAFYARDQVTAFHLAQEAIEAIRAVRDGNALQNAQGVSVDLLEGIPNTNGQPFIVDTLAAAEDAMELCSGTCDPLRSDGEFYGYGIGGSWQDTRFTRTVRAEFVNGNTDEVKISVEVRWQTGRFQERSFTIHENLYRWVLDGTII